jgi:hypothetical protein
MTYASPLRGQEDVRQLQTSVPVEVVGLPTAEEFMQAKASVAAAAAVSAALPDLAAAVSGGGGDGLDAATRGSGVVVGGSGWRQADGVGQLLVR